MFCVTPPTAIPHILVSSCPDSTGHQPGPRSLVERQGLKTAKGRSRKWEANAPPWSEPWGLFCGACSVCSGPCELREPAQGGRVRRFHLDGDRFNGRKGTTVDSLIDFSLDLMQDTPGAKEGKRPDRQANIEATLQCGHGAGAGGQHCPTCANSPAHGISCGVAQGGKKGQQVWRGQLMPPLSCPRPQPTRQLQERAQVSFLGC